MNQRGLEDLERKIREAQRALNRFREVNARVAQAEERLAQIQRIRQTLDAIEAKRTLLEHARERSNLLMQIDRLRKAQEEMAAHKPKRPDEEATGLPGTMPPTHLPAFSETRAPAPKVKTKKVKKDVQKKNTEERNNAIRSLAMELMEEDGDRFVRDSGRPNQAKLVQRILRLAAKGDDPRVHRLGNLSDRIVQKALTGLEAP